MLPIYLDIVDEAKKIINKNIWYMFELLESNCSALSYEEVLSDIFPQYIVQYQYVENPLISLDSFCIMNTFSLNAKNPNLETYNPNNYLHYSDNHTYPFLVC